MSYSVSRHNSQQDELDDFAVEQLRREIGDLLGKPEYKYIGPYLV